MKKLNVILLIFSFILSGIGGIFLFGANASNEGVIPTHAPIVEEITEYTFKTYEDYFVDYNISKETITEQDLIGTGTSVDPYVIKSERGYIYLTTLSWYNKFIQLECDIVLNDESFDIDGNPLGGDGVVYSWQKTIGNNSSNITFEGNKHTIYGLYFNDTTTNTFAGIAYDAFSVKNISLENIYMNGGTTCFPIAGVVDDIENCHLKSGFFSTSVYAHGGGCAGNVESSIKNCTNNAKFNSCAGISGQLKANVIAENCINYGSSTGNFPVGGCFGYVQDGVVIDECINYGNIKAEQSSNGGIVGQANGSLIVKNCANYGNISNETSFSSGGVIGSAKRNNITIYNTICKGQILSKNENAKGTMIGQIASSSVLKNKSTFIIKNINVEMNLKYPLIGIIQENKNVLLHLEISNSKITDKRDYSNSTGIITNGQWCGYFEINMTNTVFNIENAKHCLFYNLRNGAVISCYSVLIDYKTEIDYKPGSVLLHAMTSIALDYLAKWEIKGIIVKGNVLGEGRNEFYGSNFSGFYYSWKLGKIGLVALDGRGQFQGQIDEEWLKNKGYEKKSV